ncbi:hypothetical protein ZYGR_0AD01910 [Zygosaccharomyces rouxii]|uniref:Cation-transporting P-type ATPase N-terminal domain-containing protein n=1 Tax=Zygosaccharomyces rouxii TaxID=4956 RepID=A0A1Q3A5R3_ZYGRO|nr:hypothetical protein ZYGR_0AD01910 [Zygosaccharomyces rouxii]
MGFSVTAGQLAGMYEPKSLAKFGQLFDEEPAKLYEKLQTDKEQGISDASTESERYKCFNDNRVPERPPKTFLALAWEAFNDKTMLLLTAAAIVSLILGLYEALTQPPEYDPDGNKIPRVDWIEGVAIMLAVVVVVLVGASNDYQKEKQFLELNRKKEDRQVVVYRNGEEQLVGVHDLLVGDLMHLQTGEVVPADCILVDGNCEVDESTVTGETDAIKVAPLEQVWKRYVKAIHGNGNGNGDSSSNNIDPEAADCMLISGSKLISGLGKAVVTAVGVNSVHGKTMMSLKTEAESTPLQERLSELSDSISVFGCASAIILFLVLFIQFLFDIREGGRLADLPAAKRGSQFMSILITSITVIVVAVPEGLPLAVTLSLAYATTRMTKDGNLVRVLSACETMGSATAVCSDKTGTLTENRMTVVKGYMGSAEFDENNENNESTIKSLLEGEISDDIKKDVMTNIVLNSTAFENKRFQEQQQHRQQREDQRLRGHTSDNPFSSILTRGRSRLQKLLHGGDDDDLSASQANSVEEPYIGSKTETALLTMANKNFGLDNLKEWRKNHKGHFNIAKIVQVIPFESSRKWGGIVVKYEGEKNYRFFVKGAAEILFSRSLYYRNSDGSVAKLDGQSRQTIDEHIQGLASNALRAISIAHKDLNYEGSWPPENITSDEPGEALPEKLLSGK